MAAPAASTVCDVGMYPSEASHPSAAPPPSVAKNLIRLPTIGTSVERSVPSRVLLLRRVQLPHHFVQVEAGWLLPDRVVLEALEPLADERTSKVLLRHVLEEPRVVVDRRVATLERVG